MSENQILFLLLLLTFLRRYVSAANIKTSVQPQTLVLSHAEAERGWGSVSVWCETKGWRDRDELRVIWMVRKVNGSAKTENVVIAEQTSRGLNTSSPRMTATGGVKEKALYVTIEEVTCADAGFYTCAMFYLQAAQPITVNQTGTFRVEVLPGPITLKATKTENSLKLLCTAPVGWRAKGVQVDWIWETKKGSENWQPCDSNSDIQDVGEPVNDSCPEKRSSRLTLKLPLKNREQVYRCYVIRNNQTYPLFAGVYSEGKEPDYGVDDERDDGSDAGSDAVSGSKVVALGISMATTLVLAAICVAGWCWWRGTKASVRGRAPSSNRPASRAMSFTQFASATEPSFTHLSRSSGNRSSALIDMSTSDADLSTSEVGSTTIYDEFSSVSQPRQSSVRVDRRSSRDHYHF